MMRPTGKKEMMNKTADAAPRSGHKPPAPATPPGKTRPAEMKGALTGSPMDKMPASSGKSSIGPGGTGLAGAVAELKSQHPHAYSDLGPFHGTTSHVRNGKY